MTISLVSTRNDQARELGFACHELEFWTFSIISIDICDLHLHFSDGVVDKTEH